MNDNIYWDEGFCTFEEVLASKGREIKSKLFGILGMFKKKVVRTEEEVLKVLDSVLGNSDVNGREALDYISRYGMALCGGRKTLNLDYVDPRGKSYIAYISKD